MNSLFLKQLAGLLVYYCPLLDEMSVVPFCSMGPILLTTQADFFFSANNMENSNSVAKLMTVGVNSKVFQWKTSHGSH